MQTGYRVVAGTDVHKRMLAVVVRMETEPVQYQSRRFGTTRSEMGHLAAWLQNFGVSEAVMESTAQYWRAVWCGLERHMRLHLTHPLAVRAAGTQARFG